MNKKELTAKIDAVAVCGFLVQRRPNTLIILSYFDDDSKEWNGVGFAKVAVPDKWNATYGSDLAWKKAVAHIARQVVGKEAEYHK